jgi:hypothetical protein
MQFFQGQNESQCMVKKAQADEKSATWQNAHGHGDSTLSEAACSSEPLLRIRALGQRLIKMSMRAGRTDMPAPIIATDMMRDAYDRNGLVAPCCCCATIIRNG